MTEAANTGPETTGVGLDPALLALLVCPMTRSPLRYDAAAQELVADRAGLAYPIRGGVPIMLVDAAREFPPVE